ncbi:MAG TPA: hypothetical protein VF363_04500 [Candidatus Eisenbacteria bacterium]
MKRAVSAILVCALCLASAVPVLGTRMVCAPGMAASMTRSPDAGAHATMLADGSVCPPCPKCGDMPSSAALKAASCCRVAPAEESNALAATLANGSRAPSPDEGAGLHAATLPANAPPAVLIDPSARSVGGSPPTASPPKPARTSILRL